MSDENRDMEPGETGVASPPSVGSQLKAAREAKQMSVGDIAMALKLGARQVDALERGDWRSLPGKTFIRGFVRNYARLLQVDSAPLMSQLDAVLESPQVRLALPEQKRQVTMPQSGRTRRRDYATALSGLALLAVATAIYFLWPADFSGLRSEFESVVALFFSKEPTPASAPAAPASQAEPVFPPGTTPQQVMNPQAVIPGEAASAPAPETASRPIQPVPPAMPESQPQQPQQEPKANPGPNPAADKTRGLHFSFEQDSWVEVRDQGGKVLFSKLSRAGSEESVDGQGPFTLVIGNAPGVKVSLRGKPVDLAPRTQGNVARLTLE